MSTDPKLTAQQKLTDMFYWLGIAMSILCIVLVSARNTALLGRFDQSSFPAAWAAGLIAIVAFLASEYSHPAPAKKSRAARLVDAELSERLPWETEFADQ